MQLGLAEDEPVIKRDLEAALASGAQGHVDHDGRPGPEDLSRQTDGLLQVISGNAVFDRDAVRGIDHDPSVSAIPADTAKMRVLKRRWKLEPIAEEPIDADVTEPDQRDRPRRSLANDQPGDREDPRK